MNKTAELAEKTEGVFSSSELEPALGSIASGFLWLSHNHKSDS